MDLSIVATKPPGFGVWALPLRLPSLTINLLLLSIYSVSARYGIRLMSRWAESHDFWWMMAFSLMPFFRISLLTNQLFVCWLNMSRFKFSDQKIRGECLSWCHAVDADYCVRGESKPCRLACLIGKVWMIHALDIGFNKKCLFFRKIWKDYFPRGILS